MKVGLFTGKVYAVDEPIEECCTIIRDNYTKEQMTKKIKELQESCFQCQVHHKLEEKKLYCLAGRKEGEKE